MTLDPLREFLQRADAASGAGEAMPGDMAERIRGRVQRRRRVRAVGVAGLAGCGVVGLMVVLVAHRSGGRSPEVVKKMPGRAVPVVADGPVVDAAANNFGTDPVADARNESACTMVVLARRREKVLGAKDAAEVYERTIALFPETTWAAVARKELSDLSH